MVSVEHAMTQGLIKFVLCTSTLAQGVNLPIRYLVVFGIMQGAERIEWKDFRNLVGRAGRAGMHTEGTILFSDPSLYDQRSNRAKRWRWEAATKLLDNSATEQGSTSLLDVLAPLRADTGNRFINEDMATMLLSALEDVGPIHSAMARVVAAHPKAGFT
jgi:replicative superfamily II helicase